VLWFAGITSVIGAAYTSVSFLTTFHPSIEKNKNYWTIGFIVFSTIVFALIGKPVLLLILAGAFNGLILPLTLGCILLAAHRSKIIGDYKHPIWMTVFGIVVVGLAAFLGVRTLIEMVPQMF
jgi:Mn2+/Fe2+ NRAMP family transporter